MTRKADSKVTVRLSRPATDVLVMLAKPPVPGRVKTRLAVAGGLTAAEAAALAAAFLQDLARRLGASAAWQLLLCHPPGSSLAGLEHGLPAGVSWWEEPPGVGPRRDFGMLMNDVIEARLQAGAHRVVLVGADCPLLPPGAVEQAFGALHGRDLVLGPDDGGGCYLIGARRRLPILTAECGAGPIVWSRGTDHREIVRRASAYGVATAHVPPAFDVDEPADLGRLVAALAQPAARALAPATAACLRRLGRLSSEGGTPCTWP